MIQRAVIVLQHVIQSAIGIQGFVVMQEIHLEIFVHIRLSDFLHNSQYRMQEDTRTGLTIGGCDGQVDDYMIKTKCCVLSVFNIDMTISY